jgi:hypothetical protein
VKSDEQVESTEKMKTQDKTQMTSPTPPLADNLRRIEKKRKRKEEKKN